MILLVVQGFKYIYFKNRKLTIAGSLIGGLPETQACIDFCSKHKIVPKIKMVTAKDLGTVYKELQTKNDSIVR